MAGTWSPTSGFGSKTRGSTETRRPGALFLSSALHISLFCPTSLFFPFASFVFERLPLLRPHGKIGVYDLSSFTYQPDRKAIGRHGTA